MMRRRNVLMIIYGCLLSVYSSYAQPSRLLNHDLMFDKLPDELGLSQSSINSILQDRDGYLWIATWSGLVRYDGYETKIFHSSGEDGAIKSNLISCLYEDRDGKLWIGTHMGGLFVYDKQTNHFTNYKYSAKSKSISNNNIWSIIEDAKGNLWVGTENGLNFLDRNTGEFEVFVNDPNNSSSLSGNFVTDVFFSHDNHLWIATNKGVNELVNHDDPIKKFRHYFDERGDVADNFAYAIEEVQVGEERAIWFITKKGLKKIESGHLQNFTYKHEVPGYSLFRAMFKVSGAEPFLLLGSAMGLNHFDPNTEQFTRFTGDFPSQNHQPELESMAVTSLFIDRGGVLWVGTKKGLYKSDSFTEHFRLYPTTDFDKTNSIITGIEPGEKNNSYWISTIGGGLFNMDGEKFTSVKIHTQSKNHFVDFVQSVFKDSRGNVWMGTAGAGVISFHPTAIKNAVVTTFLHLHTTSTPAINDDYIVSFAEDKEGTIWIGTWSGGLMSVARDGSVRQFTEKLFTQAPLVKIYPDNSGTLWIGTRGNGLYKVHIRKNRPEIKHYQNIPGNPKSFPNDFVNDILEDHAGGLWFATESGLTFFDRRSEEFRLIDVHEGPGTKVIVSMLEDDAGNLWLAHWSGLTVINPADTLQRDVKNFDHHDRIQGGFYYNSVCLKDANRNLLFGGPSGLNVIDPDLIMVNPLKPAVQITDFKLFNKTVVQNELINERRVLDKPLNDTQALELSYNENSISFAFAALDFAAPEKIRYAYKLEGLDPDWNHTPATRRFANYTNLNPGTYKFIVKATNNDGIWSDKTRSIDITILPPWWKTRWAFAAYLAVIMIALFTFRKLILIRANFIHDIKMERVQRENMEKLNKAKLQFFTNISHEFRTPLTLILGPIQSLIEETDGGRVVREKLFTINTNAQRLLRLINQLLDFRKAETGNLKLEVSEANLVKFTKEIKLSFDGLAEKMGIDFTFCFHPAVIKVWFDPDQFEKILFNLFSNAFKHTPEGGTISVQVTSTEDEAMIIVEDNGRGIKPENFDRIFDSFFSYEEDRHHAGTGIGLALVKNLVDAHHGSVKAERRKDHGTRFIVTVPLGNAHFDSSELSKENKDIESMIHYPSFDPVPLPAPVNAHDGVAATKDRQARLLLVEDNEEVRNYLRGIFTNRYQVLEATNGKDGFRMAIEENPDLIISDVMMPVMDGISMCRQIKSEIATSHIPIILLTARTSLIFKLEGLETGADDYVNKPFNPKVLQLKVRNLLRARDAMQKMFRDQEVLSIEPKRVTLNSTDEKFLHQALESVEQNMSNAEYSVDDLSADVGMSRTQLYRKLKAVSGQSANEFIRMIRLKRAAQLLEQNVLTIAEVTYDVGFNDLQYFRECFKKVFGVTPSEFVQSRQSEKTKEPLRGA